MFSLCILSTHLVYSGERSLCYVLVVDLPHLGHVGEAVGAHGAEVVAGADELVEARLRGESFFVIVTKTRTNMKLYLVYEMVTGRNLARLARRVDVLLADGAVRPAQVLDALKPHKTDVIY